MKRPLCLLLIICLLPLSGCAGRIELAMMAVCLGVDVDDRGLTLTVKSPDYAGGHQKDENGYTTLSASGADWTQAVARLYETAPVTLQFGQLREVVICRDAFAALPARELLNAIDQLPSIRSHALVAVCPGTAREAVQAMQPEIGKRLSKYLDIALQHFEQQGSIPATSLSCALRDLSGSWRDPLLAYCDGEAHAGALALGSAGSLLLTEEEVQLFRLLMGDTQSFLLSEGERYYGVSLRRCTRKAVEKTDGGSILVLRLPVTFFYSVYENAPAGDPSAALEKKVRALLGRLQSVGCDALGFGCAAVREYATLQAWQRGDWPRR